MVARRMKMLPTIRKPFSQMHGILTKHGFSASEREGGWNYQARLKDCNSERTFLLNVPASPAANGWGELRLTEARIEENERVPNQVVDAALSKLKEIADYLRSEP